MKGSRQAPIGTPGFAKPLREINNLAKIFRGPNFGADPQRWQSAIPHGLRCDLKNDLQRVETRSH
jgi:hypothetical protein